MKRILSLRSITRDRAGLFLTLLISALLLAGASFYSRPQVDSRVWEDTIAGQEAHFLVVLRRQADISSFQSNDSPQRARQMVDELQKTASSSQAALVKQLDSLGASYRPYWIVNLVAVQGDRQVVEAMAERPDVAYIEPDRPFSPSLEVPTTSISSASSVQPNLSQIQATDLWSSGVTGEGITIGNADTGVEWTHPALKSKYRGWDGANADHNYNWWDAIHQEISPAANPCGLNTPAPCDDEGHGTHTMGISVGSDGSSQTGVAPGAKWIACRNMDSGVGRPSTYIECLNFFLAPTDLNGNNPDVSKRPDIISNSYGCPPTEECSPHSLQAAVEIVRSAGIFMAVSAGNNGSNGCSTVYDPPGLEKAVFSVGAVNSSNIIADFSSRGPVLINSEPALRKPDIVAPGVSIYSSYRNGNYTWLSGTSMAAPHVAGAVALLWSGLPNLRNNVDLTENALGQSALHLTSSQGCGGDSSSSIPNNVYGYGLVQVKDAYDLLSASPIPTLTTLPGLTVIPSVTVSPTGTVTPQPASQKGYLPQVSNE